MNKFSDILGIEIPNRINILKATNTTNKIKKDSIYFALQGTKTHGTKYAREALSLGASIVVHNDPNFKVKDENIFYVKNLENKIIEFLNFLYEIDIDDNNNQLFSIEVEEKVISAKISYDNNFLFIKG